VWCDPGRSGDPTGRPATTPGAGPPAAEPAPVCRARPATGRDHPGAAASAWARIVRVAAPVVTDSVVVTATFSPVAVVGALVGPAPANPSARAGGRPPPAGVPRGRVRDGARPPPVADRRALDPGRRRHSDADGVEPRRRRGQRLAVGRPRAGPVRRPAAGSPRGGRRDRGRERPERHTAGRRRRRPVDRADRHPPARPRRRPPARPGERPARRRGVRRHRRRVPVQRAPAGLRRPATRSAAGSTSR
jgi:hypothetical protein